MKNFAKETTAVLSFLTLSASAEAMEAYNKAYFDTKTELTDFDTKVKTENTITVNNNLNTENPAKFESQSPIEKPFTPEQLEKIKKVKNRLTDLRMAVAKSTGADRITAQAALDKYRAEDPDFTEVFNWYKKALKKLNFEKNRKFKRHDKRHGRDETIDRTVGVDVEISIKNEFALEKKIRQTKFIEKQTGLTNMDATFNRILANPKYAGEVIDNAELNKEIFAGFSKEFQEVLTSMNIKVRVEKYDDEIEVYFEYGTRVNNEGKTETAEVEFLENDWENSVIYVTELDEYGKVLAQTDSEGIIQILREKNGIIEDTNIREDGTFNPRSIKAQKNPLPAKNLAQY